MDNVDFQQVRLMRGETIESLLKIKYLDRLGWGRESSKKHTCMLVQAEESRSSNFRM